MLLLVRHGEALPAQSGGEDRDRFLSQRGRDEVRRLALALRARGIVPTRFIASPLARAVQTAELLAFAMDFSAIVALDPRLEPDEDPDAALLALPNHAGQTLVVVCHEPIVRHMASRLTRSFEAPFATAGALGFDEGRVLFRVPG